MKKRIALLSLLIVMTAAALQAGVPAKNLTDAQVKERIAWIQGSLDSAQPAAQAWWYGWMALYGSATVAQETLAGVYWRGPLFKRDRHYLHARKVWDRTFGHDMLVGGLTTAVGMAGQLVFPFKPAYLPDRLRAMPDATAAERLAKLTAAEDFLSRCAAQELDGWGWQIHLMNLGVNLAAGMAITFTRVYCLDKSWKRGAWDGFLMFAEGEVVSLINIYTQPRRAIRDLKAYRSRFGRDGSAGGDTPEREIFVGLCPGAYGLTVGMRF